MKPKQIIFLVIAVAIFAIVLYSMSKEPSTPIVEVETQTFSDPDSGLFFTYPETLPYVYMHVLNWPPEVTVSNSAFVCSQTDKIEGYVGSTTEKVTINDRIYCLHTLSEGAAGSVYTTYIYTFSQENKLIALKFDVRAQQCANYDGDNKTACEKERTAFNPNNLVDQIRRTVRFTNPQASTSSISGMVLIGPTCPVQMDPPTPECADKPYRANLVLITSDQGRIVKNFSSDAEGKFNVEVSVGKYLIRSAVANTYPYCGTDGPIDVLSGTTTPVFVHCDSGIR